MTRRSLRRPALECRFYRSDVGGEPVRLWLRQLPAEVRKEVGSDIQVVQWRWPIGPPVVDGLGAGLFEVRAAFEGVQYRVLFCITDSTMVLLHGFVKKTRKTPKAAIALARRRMADLEAAK